MKAPTKPRIRPPAVSYRAVAHETYNYKREHKLGGTSFHLWFTESKLPLGVEALGTIDHDAYIVETVISVRDQGDWVADIDILTARAVDYTVHAECRCDQHQKILSGNYQSIDSWKEILGISPANGIVRANGNWSGRLAALCILLQTKQDYQLGVIGAQNSCLACLETKWWRNGTEIIYID